ncbi:MAG: AbiV family abortive infection protein [Candidatus Scalinduaceae bacterium]
MDIHTKPISLPQGARDHLEKYWLLARRFYEKNDFALASFFAITLIEEVGKIIILGNKDLSGKLDKRSFYNHEQKYIYAVGMTLEVNARVKRIYGREESRFAKWFRDGDLFKIRNSSIYIEIDNGRVQVPADSISRADSFLLVCISGEIYGEIQGLYSGTGPTEWQRIIKEADEFRENNQANLHSA